MSLNGLAGAHRKKTNMAAARFGNVFTVLMFVIVNQIMIQRSVPTAPLQHPFCPGFQSVNATVQKTSGGKSTQMFYYMLYYVTFLIKQILKLS